MSSDVTVKTSAAVNILFYVLFLVTSTIQIDAVRSTKPPSVARRTTTVTVPPAPAPLLTVLSSATAATVSQQQLQGVPACLPPPTDFDDVPSKTFLADVVFEGRALTSPPAGSSSPVDGGRRIFNVKFSVTKVIKGQLVSGVDGGTQNLASVVVGPFGSSLEDIVDAGQLTGLGLGQGLEVGNCVLPTVVQLHAQYVVFTATSNQQEAGEGGGDVFYRVVGRPEPSSKRTLKEAAENNCTKCGKSAVCRLNVRQPTVEVAINKKLQLDCRGQGHPAPRYSWFKDDMLLTANKLLRITAYKRGSKLQIAKVRDEDTGIYKCRVANVLGSSESKPVRVAIKPATTATTKPHSKPCPQQGFCLNGGTCFILSNLQLQFCECSAGYSGNRCQEKFLGTRKSTEDENWLSDGMKTTLVIIGSAILLSLCIAILVTLCCVARRCREAVKSQRQPDNYSPVNREKTPENKFLIVGKDNTGPTSEHGCDIDSNPPNKMVEDKSNNSHHQQQQARHSVLATVVAPSAVDCLLPTQPPLGGARFNFMPATLVVEDGNNNNGNKTAISDNVRNGVVQPQQQHGDPKTKHLPSAVTAGSESDIRRTTSDKRVFSSCNSAASRQSQTGGATAAAAASVDVAQTRKSQNCTTELYDPDPNATVV